MNLTIQQVTNLSRNTVNDYAPLPLPDGQIVFVSDRDGSLYGDGEHLYIMNATGSEVRRLSETTIDNFTRDTMPALSPSGQIIFSSRRLENPQLYTIDVNEGGRVRLSRDNTRSDISPAWQPVSCADLVIPEAR